MHRFRGNGASNHSQWRAFIFHFKFSVSHFGSLVLVFHLLFLFLFFGAIVSDYIVYVYVCQSLKGVSVCLCVRMYVSFK